MKFAYPVYCAGVDNWYLRLGKQHGVDVMFVERSERSAKLHAKLINVSLTRDLNNAAVARRRTKPCRRKKRA